MQKTVTAVTGSAEIESIVTDPERSAIQADRGGITYCPGFSAYPDRFLESVTPVTHSAKIESVVTKTCSCLW